jgi:hypothetical protein
MFSSSVLVEAVQTAVEVGVDSTFILETIILTLQHTP